VLTEAFALADERGERAWEPELYRLRGELILQGKSEQGGSPIVTLSSEAEACFQRAIEIARQQRQGR